MCRRTSQSRGPRLVLKPSRANTSLQRTMKRGKIPPPPSDRGPRPRTPPPPPPPLMRGRAPLPPPRLPKNGFAARQSLGSLKPLHWIKISKASNGSLWEELQRHGEEQIASEFDSSGLETLFSARVIKPANQRKSIKLNLENARPIELERANNIVTMLTELKMPVSDFIAAVLGMDNSILNVDHIETLIKNFPTEEMELLKNYTGDKATLGKCEQYLLKLVKVPRVESKLRVFSFKIQFGTQITELKKSFNVVNYACEEIRTSQKLKEIMKRILYLGNKLNQGTARGAAIGFKLDSLLRLSYTRASNKEMTLMHYLCKVFASKASTLLDFHQDLNNLESASKIQLKSLAHEMQAITKGLDQVNQELTASKNDGLVYKDYYKTLKDFMSIAETEVRAISSLHCEMEKNADALVQYFGEDPKRCPFEQATATLLEFIRLFKKAHEENLEFEIKKAEEEEEMVKAKAVDRDQ